MRFDSGWFNDLIRRSPYKSQRQLAPKIRGRNGKALDPSAVSLMLRGKRAMQMHEARQFADLLDVPLIEILRHAGVALPEEGTRIVPVVGHLDKDGVLHFTKDKSASKEMVAGPGDLPPDAIAVRWMTARSEHDLIDGWIVFADKPGELKPEAIGRFCIVSPKKDKPGVAFVQRGYKSGTVNLLNGIHGFLRPTENTHVDWVAPVLWIRPQQ